ncbi:Rib/alpha-like domain-containing protein, partial [Limosilactobacillus reuteri]|uniref:Rib/alpha-like domain-containing protein n=1 Tax=Limosilactobacillus reuteri TaxID=1598 RepID=UPI002AFEE6C7
MVSANQTSNTSAAGAPASSNQTVTVDETTLPATQAAILFTNFARTNIGTDTTLPTTTQTYTPVEQPLLYDYLLHTATGTRDGKTWVDKTVDKGHTIFSPDYRGNTLDTIFGTTSKPGIITSNPDKYFFAAYVDFSEPFHRVILLARSKDLNDKNLYSYTIHTYTQNHSTTTTKPGDSTKEQYTGTGGSTHDLIFQNYDGDSFSVKLNGFKEGHEYGLLPVFDGGLLDPTYGSNTYDQNNKAAETKSIGFWASAIPQETSTKVRYVDQATGKDIVQPMEISGFGYQGFKVKGEAPTVPGYNLVSKPKFLGLPYEDGTIAPYKVGQTYDLALSDSLVIKQTVIDTDGFVRATAYYKGSPLSTYYKGSALSTSTSKVLGRGSDNNSMSFFAPDGQWCTYTNRIGQVDDSYIYYYAKESDPNGSEMRLHFIDVTGVNNSAYAPSDGPELADKVQTIHGKMGNNYIFTYTVPTNYYEVGSSGVTGTYSKTHHDAYVYVKKQAENKLYAPVASDPLTVEQGTMLTTGQAKAAVKYNGDVPSDATYAWDPKTPVDTATVGLYTPNVIVTYGDSTTSQVPVTVNVVAKDKSNYTVTAGQPVTLTHGQKVKAGDSLDSSAVILKDAKGQVVSFPDRAKVVWTTAPDTSEVGNAKTGQAKVVYGDQSESEAVTVTYNVTQNDADQYTPTPVKTPVKTNENTTLTDEQAKAAISNTADLPADTKYTWSQQPDTTKSGDKTGEVKVTYPDGSSESVTVPVHVNSAAETHTPTPVKTPVKTNENTTLTDEQAKAAISNTADLPADTKYTWSQQPDTTKSGDKTGEVKVTYPDGSSESVTVPVHVNSAAETHTPTPVKTPVKTNENTTLTDEQAKAAISNTADLPADTKYTWSQQPDTTKSGDKTGEVKVTYPDGSSESVTVPVHVNSAAET